MDEREPSEADQDDVGTDAGAADTDAEATGAEAGQNAPIGGDESTESRLEADNAVEEDMLKALGPDSPS